MEDRIDRLEKICLRLESAIGKLGGSGTVDEDAPPAGYLALKSVFDNELQAFLKEWSVVGDGSYPVGGNDKTKKKHPKLAVALLSDSFSAVLEFTSLANKCKKPSNDQAQEKLVELKKNNKYGDKLERTNVKSLRPFDLQHEIVAEIVRGMWWVLLSPPNLPTPHWRDGVAQTVQTKLNKMWKNRQSPDHEKPFRDSCKKMMDAVTQVISDHFKTGVEWCGKEDISGAKAVSAPAPAKKEEEDVAPKKDPAKKTVDFASELTGKGSVTKGLKKVARAVRKKKPEKSTVSGGPTKARIKKKKESKKFARGKEWMYQDYQNQDLVTVPGAEVSPKHGVRFIDCINTNFIVKEKAKSITLDSCKRVQVQIDGSLISTLEMINCRDVTVWALSAIPTITLDKCDSPTIQFNKDGWGCNPTIVYSSCSAANLYLPPKEDGGEQVVVALPEQVQVKGYDYDTRKPDLEFLEHAD